MRVVVGSVSNTTTTPTIVLGLVGATTKCVGGGVVGECGGDGVGDDVDAATATTTTTTTTVGATTTTPATTDDTTRLAAEAATTPSPVRPSLVCGSWR